MAKAKSSAKSEKQKEEAAEIVCKGYRLTANNHENAFIFELEVTGSDGKEYHLRVRKLNDRTGLVQSLLHKLAELWPAYDFHFKVDQDNEITEIV